MKIFIKYKILIIPLLIFNLIIVLHYTKIITPAENIVHRLLNSVKKIIYQKSLTASARIANAKISKTDLLKQIDEQKIKILDLTYENLQLQNLKEENKHLRELLNFQETAKQKVILADIISKNNLVSDITFNINRGIKHGILKDMAVIYGEGVIVGKIFQVQENTSTVLLLTDNNSRLAVNLEENLGTQGLLRGTQGLSLILDLVPIDTILKPKQKVLTSGAEQVIPKGLIVGEIESLIPTGDSLFQTAVVKPMIDYDKLDVVGVVE